MLQESCNFATPYEESLLQSSDQMAWSETSQLLMMGSSVKSSSQSSNFLIMDVMNRITLNSPSRFRLIHASNHIYVFVGG